MINTFLRLANLVLIRKTLTSPNWYSGASGRRRRLTRALMTVDITILCNDNAARTGQGDNFLQKLQTELREPLEKEGGAKHTVPTHLLKFACVEKFSVQVLYQIFHLWFVNLPGDINHNAKFVLIRKPIM